MNAANWTVTNEVAKPDWIDGTGWLEANALVRPDGKVCCLSRIASDEGIYAGYFELKDDATIDETTVGKRQFYGAASKFTVRYDEKTGMYWSLANYVPDSLQKANGNRSAGGMRSILALTSSADLNEWKVNAIVLASDDVDSVGFQYVDFIFDGDDILFLSRTSYDDGLGGGDGYHNANFMTFHRIENYATATTPQQWQHYLPNAGWNGSLKDFDAANGKGDSPANPIIIDHPGQLVRLSEEVYKGNSFQNKYFRIDADIDLNYQNFLPIGWYASMSSNRPFSGIVDGNAHRILHLKIGRHDDINHTNGALFGYLLNTTVSDLGIDGNTEILSGGVCGALCAMAKNTTFSNCYAKVNAVTASNQVGAMIGYAHDNTVINNCYAIGHVYMNNTVSYNKFVGGLVGYLDGSITNSYAACNVQTLFDNADNIGGLVGSLKGNADNSFYCNDSVSQPVNAHGIAKSAIEMQSAGFLDMLNRNDVWTSPSDVLPNSGYPVLKWQLLPAADHPLQDPSSQFYRYRLYNILGQPCGCFLLEELNRQMSLLPKGMYIVSVENNNKIVKSDKILIR